MDKISGNPTFRMARITAVRSSLCLATFLEGRSEIFGTYCEIGLLTNRDEALLLLRVVALRAERGGSEFFDVQEGFVPNCVSGPILMTGC